MQRLLMFLTLVLLLAVNGRAWGYLTVGNEPLNHSLYAKYPPRLIVVGHITGIDKSAPWPVIGIGPPHNNFQFRVVSVVLGSATQRGQIITVPVNSFMWPEELLPFAVGSRCALVLQEHLGEKQDQTALLSVVPVGNETLPVARHNRGAVRILEGALITQLKAENKPQRQQALLRQLAPILTNARSGAVVPFAKSNEATVARAALSALIYATGAKAYIREGARDIAHFFARLKPDAPDYAVRNLYADYFFLDAEGWRWGHRWGEAEADKHRRLVAALFATGLLSAKVKEIIEPAEERAARSVPSAP